MENQILHEVVITAIVVKDGGSAGTSAMSSSALSSLPKGSVPNGSPETKYLITRRSKNKKRFPGMWTVPGGKLEVSDYVNLPKDTEHYWYNVLEKVLKREVREETGIEINNIEYLTSLATVHADGAPSLVISVMADYVSGEIKLQEGETDAYVWVSLEEAKEYKLIDGILDELVMAEDKRKGIKTEWKRILA